LPVDILAKGLGVAALSVAALLLPGKRWLAAIMAAGATGDILLEVPGMFYVGAGAFAIGHVIAILFYMGQRRAGLGLADRIAALALIGYGLAMPTLVMPAGAPVGAPMLYSVLLCGMATAALLSRFAPRWVGLGALLFVVSDTLLIMRMGGSLVGSAGVHGLLVWYSYYLGQFCIFYGVATADP
jgi:uncharacterized membrane protein YhhN